MHSADAFVREGLEMFDGGLSCAEVVALMGMRRLGRTSELLPRIATGFAGGVSRTKSLCGAVAGAVLVLGIAHGRDKKEDDRSLILTKVQGLMSRFRERFGSENCYTLTGLDWSEPGAMDVYRERVHAHCRTYVEQVLRELLTLVPRPSDRDGSHRA
jgi:C_GCAxxG_C_C family probable redox protein